MTDEEFFATFPDRQAHIRKPDLIHSIDRQRATGYADECHAEFIQLGPHKRERRRVILWRVPPGNPWFDPMKPSILKIPFLAFADETIEDRDDVLLPIVHEIMSAARMQA